MTYWKMNVLYHIIQERNISEVVMRHDFAGDTQIYLGMNTAGLSWHIPLRI